MDPGRARQPASATPCPACVAAGPDEEARQARTMRGVSGNEQRCCNGATGITGEFFPFKQAPSVLADGRAAAPNRGRDPCVPPPSPSPEDSMRRLLAVFLAATLLASGAAPLIAGAPARLRRQQADARVIGRVVDARTHAPLSSVRVSVGGTEIGVLTNAAGRYERLGAGAGTHHV